MKGTYVKMDQRTNYILSPKKYAIARLVQFIKAFVSLIIVFIPFLRVRWTFLGVEVASESYSPLGIIIKMAMEKSFTYIILFMVFTAFSVSLCFGKNSMKKTSKSKFEQYGKDLEYAAYLYSRPSLPIDIMRSVFWSIILVGSGVFIFDCFGKCDNSFSDFFKYVNVLPLIFVLFSYVMLFWGLSNIWKNDSKLVEEQGVRLKDNAVPTMKSDFQAIDFLLGNNNPAFLQMFAGATKLAEAPAQAFANGQTPPPQQAQQTPTCSAPAQPATPNQPDELAMLYRYKKMLDDGIITEEEYQEKKREALHLKDK